jgi:ATP-dependent DNA helicase RecQ
VLRGEETVQLAVDRTPQRGARGGGRRAGGASRAAESLEPAQRERFEALRSWRTGVAKEKQIPPYMVFSDATLVAIVETAPGSVQQLGTVSGVGAKKLAEYGEAVLEALAEASP